MENKRNSRRIKFKERIKYGASDIPNTDGTTVNISPKGIAIKSYKALTPGSKISVVLYSGNNPIRLEGEVVWNSPPKEGAQAEMGVKVLSKTKELEQVYKQASRF
ncbi:MAG TPA: PilZ domain-containing protein [Thermodesulfobacteriota bacterium]|nr:PilZ domain-containing protein [Thermodesulfobacteriota bacterium]